MILSSASGLSFVPRRIISLVPSQTELLHYLGLNEETIGITKFCIHPKEWFRTKTRIGGTKNINLTLVKKLQPDLIIANKEENIKEQVEELAKDHAVWVTDVNTVSEALAMITDIGTLTGKINAAAKLVAAIRSGFDQVRTQNIKYNTCYLIWKDPYMTVGGDTFIGDMLQLCGFANVFANESRYPQLTVAMLQHLQSNLVMLSSEPYPFKQKHITALQQQLPQTKIVLVNGEMFSWYGSRMLLMPAYINELARVINDEW